jgi:hypothetical protein
MVQIQHTDQVMFNIAIYKKVFILLIFNILSNIEILNIEILNIEILNIEILNII